MAAAASPTDRAWRTLPVDEVFAQVGGSDAGLSSSEAARRLALFGPNALEAQRAHTRLRAIGAQLKSPMLLLLLVAAVLSVATGEYVDGAIVVAIVVASVGISASREFRAQSAADLLRRRTETRARVVRDGAVVDVAAHDVVRGDVLVLSAGSVVPADARLVAVTDFYVNEGVLTGESFPVDKKVVVGAGDSDRAGAVFCGSNVRSGSARAVVVRTGGDTEFGDIATRLRLRPPETEFDRGLRRFGVLLMTAMSLMVLIVFAANMLLGRPVVETLLFAVALAVGLSPELLPAVLSVSLARGAQAMARHGVLVRRLNAIENLGSMNVLCTDKTGTLTAGVIELDGAYDVDGVRDDGVLALAAENAALQTGLQNPLDDAVLARRSGAARPKLGEIPWDFVRKQLSVVVADGDGACLITKGAYAHVMAACVRTVDGAALDDVRRAGLDARFQEWSSAGIRVLAVATKTLPRQARYGRDDEGDLTLRGFLTFLDREKPGAKQALADLGRLGVAVKLITGDAALVARHVAQTVGLGSVMLTGKDLDELHDDALCTAAARTDLFVEVDPNQKERIVLALKKLGHVTGFLGDGVNDAPAMHAADTSISVASAVDVAREAADFVLVSADLDVIRRGIEEGRRTFANTLKYVLTTTSANLGNMVSMAVASLFLPFLPLTAGQVLLNNFLSDVPAVGIANDAVDVELVDRPRRWDMRLIGRFMLQFGLLSSLFDALTFVLLLYGFAAGPALFRTGWFVESLLTELVIALVVRTRRPFFRSRPGRFLLVSSLVLMVVAVALPALPGVALFGFVPLPMTASLAVIGLALAYGAAAEVLKAHFYRPRPRRRAPLTAQTLRERRRSLAGDVP